jgi:hypothetical protein
VHNGSPSGVERSGVSNWHQVGVSGLRQSILFIPGRLDLVSIVPNRVGWAHVRRWGGQPTRRNALCPGGLHPPYNSNYGVLGRLDLVHGFFSLNWVNPLRELSYLFYDNFGDFILIALRIGLNAAH